MRSPKRQRPQVRGPEPPPSGVDLVSVAAKTVYVGSPEHKDCLSFAGQPRPRSDASICDRNLAWKQSELTEWLREGIRNGLTGHPWEGGFPRYAWCKKDGVGYEARLVNQGTGEYKGYPLTEDEWRGVLRNAK